MQQQNKKAIKRKRRKTPERSVRETGRKEREREREGER